MLLGQKERGKNREEFTSGFGMTEQYSVLYTMGENKARVKLFLNFPEDFEATSNRIICQDHDHDIKSSKKEVSLDSVESLAKHVCKIWLWSRQLQSSRFEHIFDMMGSR